MNVVRSNANTIIRKQVAEGKYNTRTLRVNFKLEQKYKNSVSRSFFLLIMKYIV